MANRIILIALSVGYAALCVRCAAEAYRREQADRRAVYMPRFVAWIGAIGAGLFISVAWAAAIQDDSVGLTVGFGAFASLGMLLMFSWSSRQIVYDAVGFVWRDFFGRKRSFRYGDVTACKLERQLTMIVYVAGKKVFFPLSETNGVDFLLAINAEYKKLHDGSPIPLR